MILFVYSDASPSQKQYLLSLLPPNVSVRFADEVDERQGQQDLEQAHFLYGNPPPAWFENPLPHLKFWQIDSVGFDQYAATHVEAQTANMGDFYAVACAETMLAGILAFYRGIPALQQLQTQHTWKGKALRNSLEMLSGKKVLILGAGSIGIALQKLIQGFSCEVVFMARQNPIAQIKTQEELYKKLPTIDVVVNTLPGHLENFVSQNFIEKMKPGSVYASVGRGNTTDEEALLSALSSGHLAGAVLDVTVQEPLPENSALWAMGQVILTQHTGGGQKMEVEGKIDRFIINLNAFLNNEKLTDAVQLSKGY